MRTRSLARSRSCEIAKRKCEGVPLLPTEKNAVHRSIEKGDRGGEEKEKKGKRKENERCLSEERERVHANANPAIEGRIIGELEEAQRQNVSR